MAVLIFHSYLLRGTGSNVYNVELARELARRGHDVHIFCQDRGAGELPWVDAVGRWSGGRLSVAETAHPRRAEFRGRVTAYVPDIGGLLPVFVHDQYAGFRVKTFPELTDAELSRYLEANVRAVSELVERSGPFDACLANHLIMAPSILARAGVRFAVKVHGSDLSYAVVPHSDRFASYAAEGVEAAEAVLVGSTHTAERLWEAVPVPGLIERTRLGPPGLDARRFRPGRRSEAVAELSRMRVVHGEAEEGPFGRRPREAVAGLRWFAAAEGPRVLYVGKLLINKGVDLLLAAWPMIHAGAPGARLLLGGFGQFRPGIEHLWAALSAGDLERARGLALAAVEETSPPGPPRRLAILARFLADPPAGYAEASRQAAGSVLTTGRLEHAEVAEAMAAADLLYVPSTLPEAFGMVVAEAAASGTFPIAADHSGLSEVCGRLGGAIGEPWSSALSFDLQGEPVAEMATKGLGWLSAPAGERRAVEGRLALAAAESWGWERVATEIIAASKGDLGRLRAPRRTFRELQ